MNQISKAKKKSKKKKNLSKLTLVACATPWVRLNFSGHKKNKVKATLRFIKKFGTSIIEFKVQLI